MGRYGTKTNVNCKNVIEKAVDFFGPTGQGLIVKVQENDFARFEGSGGYVNVKCAKKEEETDITIETREWDTQVKKFMKHLK